MMILEPLAIQVLGAVTTKTALSVLDFLGDRLKCVVGHKQDKSEVKIQTLLKEVEDLREQLHAKKIINDEELKLTETKVEEAYSLQQQYGLELISDQVHKEWILKQFEDMGTMIDFQSFFQVDIWTQKSISNVPKDSSTVSVVAPVSYKIGDRVTFFFCSSHDCYLTLFNLGTSGAITILFPNRLFPDNFIKADCINSIPGAGYPFEYELSGPAGVERIIAIASIERVDLTDLDFSQMNTVFHSAERSAAAKDIRIVGKRMKEQPSISWARAACEFIVS